MEARPDDDYVEFVRARQCLWLQAAYVVTGDRPSAVDVLDASLWPLARSWHRLRSQDPDSYVLRRLYPAAVAAGRRNRAAPALLDLTPGQRAVAVLVLLEERTDAEAAAMLGWRVGKARNQMELALRCSRGADALVDGLRAGAGRVSEIDVAISSWDAAWQQRRRRRAAGVSVAGLSLVGLLATGLIGENGPTPQGAVPALTTPPAAQTGGFKRTFSGIAYVRSPVAGGESRLAKLPSRFPDTVSSRPQPPGRWDWPRHRPLTAVVLVKLPSDQYAVSLIGPDGVAVRVPGLTLEPTAGPRGAAATPLPPPLSAAAVSPDGLTVVFPQPGHVTLLTVSTGQVRTAPIPGAQLRHAGWTSPGTHVIAGSGNQSWLIDVETLLARRLTSTAPASQFLIGGSGLPRPFLQTWDADGQYVGGEGLPLPPDLEGHGDTVNNEHGWVGRAVSLIPDIPSSSTGDQPEQALAAVRSGHPDTARLLLFETITNETQPRNHAVGWKGQVMIYTSPTARGHLLLLGWDVMSGEVLKVSRVPGEALALGPGL